MAHNMLTEGTNPIVKVHLDSKQRKITIEDNGRGMDWMDCRIFLLCMAKTLYRKKGKPGRGLFGTGNLHLALQMF